MTLAPLLTAGPAIILHALAALAALGLFAGGPVIAGLFTLAPGRILHRVMVGG